MKKQNPKELQGDAQPKDSPITGGKWAGRSSFTLTEAAEILGLSRWAAYHAAKRQELPVVQIGRRKIVPRVALERLLLSA